MNSALDREYGFWSLLKFAFPSIIMMIFMSLYTIVDGAFISRYVGPDALAAANVIYPYLSTVLAAGVMLATGGSAVIARKLGEGQDEVAREDFSLLVLVGAGLGILFAAAGLLFLEPISRLLGANDTLMVYCRPYLGILALFAPGYILQLLFQSFFVTAGRPGLGLGLTVLSGVANAILDYVLIVPAGLGIAGAALATAAGYLLTAVPGMIFFLRQGQGLHFVRPRWKGRMLLRVCGNGSSEMVTNLANAVVTVFYNILMLRFLGETGVAAITIVLYAQFLLTALFLGFSIGVAPIISFNHGAGNIPRLKRLFRICMTFVAISSASVFAVALLMAKTVVSLFSPLGTAVYPIALDGFYKFSPAFFFSGLNIFTSALFTALSDGLTSAVVSFARTFGFLLVGLLLLPALLGVDGVWLAVPFAEALCCLLSLFYLVKKRKRYQYV